MNRFKNNNLANELFSQSKKFNFFQAINLLEKLIVQNSTSSTKHLSILQQDTIQFKANIGLHFNATALNTVEQEINSQTDNNKINVVVNFIGLLGSSGVLPNHYTELCLQKLRDKDTSLTDFLTIFHQRIVTLFYAAWKKYNFPVNYEQARVLGKSDFFTQFLTSLTSHANEQNHSLSSALLTNAGHFANKVRNPAALQGMLQSYFGTSITIAQFIPEWLYLPDEERSRLSYLPMSNQLGRTLVSGHKTLQCQHKFRVKVGPLTAAQFKQFLPYGSNALTKLSQLVRYYVGMTLQFDVQLEVEKKEVPSWRLQLNNDFQLGWNTWLFERNYTNNVTDVILSEKALKL